MISELHLFDNQEFIKEHRDLMYQDRDGVSHCLLVLGEGEEDGILVESEGSLYARYSALLPNARSYMQKNIQTMARISSSKVPLRPQTVPG